MEFSVKKFDLLEELNLTQGVVERKTTIPILSNLLAEAKGNRLTITATDLELSIRTSCEAKVEKEGGGTIPAKKLLELVRLLPDEEIHFRLLENHWVQIVSDRKAYKLVGMAKDNFPAIPAFPHPLVKIPARVLAALIAKTSFAISMEESRYTLNGGLLLLKPEMLAMVATDGHVGHLIKKRNPASRLTYSSAERFTNEVINSLRFDRMTSFRDRFRTVDVLLVDDIQFIAGKERTQEEFFHTFNTLYEQQKQIVVSSDCPPKEISAIEERLRSRFEWGLIADIQPPDLETKIAILQKKAESERVHLPDEVAEFIARSIKSNVRELEGALTRLLAYASLIGATVTLSTAQQVLKNIIATQEKKVTIELIQKRVGEQFGLREQDLKVRSNSKAIAFPRQIAMYLVKQLTSASLPEIGRQFGGKHHTTVLHSINKIDSLRRSDKDLNRTINKLLDSFV